MKWICILWAALLVFPGFAAETNQLKIVTSFPTAYSLTIQVTRGLAEVKNLLPGNASLHDYQLSPKDVRTLNSADLIIINGLGLESFLERALRNSNRGTRDKTVELSAGLGPRLIPAEPHHHDSSEPHHHSDFNPHTWLDPNLATHGVSNILSRLRQADPRHAADYQRNASELVERLKKLDAEIEQKLAPIKNVPFLTYHDAFPYFTRRYGLNRVGVVELVPEVPPSVQQMKQLLELIRKKKVRALFTEPRERSRLAKQIAEDSRIALGELDPLEGGMLTAEAYEAGMRRNVDNLLKTLQ